MASARMKPILIVDDDQYFRQLLTEILQANGFPVAEARSAKEAMSLVSNASLAIIDYRLPETDGMTLIAQIRDAGNQVPVVFVSGTWCDAKTFNRLRNLLRVSLVLQKPIDANLFLQQIEGLLPVGRQQPISTVGSPRASFTNLPQQEYAQNLMERTGVASGDHEPFEPAQEAEFEAPSLAGDAELMAHLQQMNKKLAVEAKIREAQAELAKQMPGEWSKLSQAVSKLQADPSSSEKREAVLGLAHRLKGTSGSLGLDKVSQCGGQVESLVAMLDPDNSTEHELLWSEIFRHLADGETAMRVAGLVEVGQSAGRRFSAGRVLVLASEEAIGERLKQLDSLIDIEVTRVEKPVDAVVKSTFTRFDAAIVDLGLISKSAAFSVAKEVRLTVGNEALPLAFLVPGNELLLPEELTFVGCSSFLNVPFEQKAFENTLYKLSQARQLKRPRILTVDDDELLTKFIHTVLSSIGMQVSVLNEPIRILDALNATEPDLVLLDVMMPGLSGYDVCKLIRSSHTWGALPIVFLTSKSDAQGRAAAFQAGGDDFLSKPVLSEELIARINAQLERSRLQRQSITLDELTGVLKEDVFLRRLDDTFNKVQAAKQSLSLCLLTIDYFDELDRYGIFAGFQVLATIGKLLQSRFKAEVVRGRWGERGFALAFEEDVATSITGAMEQLTQELSQISFAGEFGRKFDVSITYAVASYPTECTRLDDLLDEAKTRLAMSTRRKTGVTFT